MKIKRYYSPSSYEGYKQIRDELGTEAMILYSQKVRQAGWLGYVKSPVYEIGVAVDVPEEEAGPRMATPTPQGGREPAGGVSAPDSTPATDLAEINRSLALMQDELGRLRGPTRNGSRPGSRSPNIRMIEERLAVAGVDDGLRREIAKEIQSELNSRALQSWEATYLACHSKVVSHLHVAPMEWPLHPDTAAIFVVGPTGVGKTTTIAKLTARLSSLGARRVSLATLDTKRIGGISQLQAYADILGVPLEIAYTPLELRQLVSSRPPREITLVDSPGLSRRDWRGVGELAEFIGSTDHAIVYLALSITTRDEEMVRIIEDFSSIPIHGLVLTKLDETEGLGAVLNLVWRSAKPLVYLTTGQNVPDDIEFANAAELARKLLGN